MKKSVFTLLFIIGLIPNAVAYDNDFVHQSINENAAKQSNNLLINLRNLGFSSDLENIVYRQKIYKWFHEGARLEDETICRSRNHFHDPLKSWEEAGLNNAAVNTLCLAMGEDFSVDSSIIWSQKEPGLLFTKNSWSWPKAREYYYNALKENDKVGREVLFAQTFRSLGQVIHLLADSSVPAHVRNDIHVFPLTVPGIGIEVGNQTYESWAKKNYDRLNYSGITLNNSIFSQAISNLSAPIPISALWDQDKYNGTNLDITITGNVGLAEYTSANFFSEDTIFRDYPHPAYADTNYPLIDWKNPETVDAEDGRLDKRIYINGVADELYPRLASLSYISYDLIKKGSASYSPLVLDDKVYEDYAQKLIPRAVGYSVGLLDYFFRGSIEVSLPDSGIYAQTADAGMGFSNIAILARNTTSNGDDMTDGSLELVARYRIALQDPFQSYPVPTTEQFSYIVVPEKNNVRSIPKDTPVELIFDAGQNTIIPRNATDVYIQVVYRGRLGNEDGAVAVGMKDISEPTPVDIFNNMDMICLNGTWYAAGSPEAIAQVDTDQDGEADEWDVFTHDIHDAYVKVSSINNPINASPTDYTFYSQVIGAGELFRTYILSDFGYYAVNISDYLTPARIDGRDTFNHDDALIRGSKSGYAIRNQVAYNVQDQAECENVARSAPCDIRYYPVFYSFRGKNLWGPAGFIIDNPKYPQTTSCSWDLLN